MIERVVFFMAFVEKKRWLFLGLPFTFTKYTVTEEQITINSGFFTRIENDCYMYKIQDTVLSVSLFQRIFGIATVVCKTSDVTHGQLVLKNIKNAKAIKDFIVECSEEQRLKRRTINTLNIDADVDGEIDEL
jgi:uncharacterized membrane protein YdbT with pleckstrin-like domain